MHLYHTMDNVVQLRLYEHQQELFNYDKPEFIPHNIASIERASKQWLEYLKLMFLEIPNVTTWLLFQNRVTNSLPFNAEYSKHSGSENFSWFKSYGLFY